MNDSAQIHVLEVIIVAGMLLTSLFFVRTFEFTPNITTNEENELEILGNGILSNLESVPDNYGDFPSLLSRYVYYDEINKIFSNADDFIDYIDASIPDGTLYEISRINISYYSTYPEKSIKDEKITEAIKDAEVKVGREAISSRIVTVGGSVYEVVLTMYFTLR